MTGRKLIERRDTDRGEEVIGGQEIKPYDNDIIDHNEVDLEMDGLKQPQDSEADERDKIIASINAETMKELTDKPREDAR